MAKKALLDVLEQTIGKYVKNLDAESLNVAVWSGKIELNALELNVDAVNAEFDRQAAEAPNLALPLRVISGSFRSFEVDVPWAKITSKPIVLRARGLKVSVEPYDRLSRADHLHMTFENEMIRAKKILEARLQSLKLADEFRRRANSVKQLAAEVDDRDKKKGQDNQSFGARLVRRLIENIQIEIEDVQVELKSEEGTAGVVLESLLLVTTDKDGQRTYVDRFSGKQDESMSFLYKILEIRGLGFYLDEESRRASLAPISEEEDEDMDHSFILAPLSFVARLRQSDSTVCVDYPKYLLASELTSLSILLSRPQVEMGYSIIRSMRPSQDAARPLFPEFRPLSRVTKESAHEWWKYAYRCVRRLNNGRWGEFFEAFLIRKRYIMLYKRATHYAENKWIRPLTWEEQEELDDIEENRSISVEGLMAWRNIADAQVERERLISEKRAAESKPSIFGSLFATKDKTKTDEDDPPITLSVEELKELESVGLEHVSDDELSRDSKLCDAKFTLGSFKINLISHGMRPVAALSMGTVVTSFDAMVDGSYTFEFNLSGLDITDMVTPKSHFPTILKYLPPPSSDASSARQAEAFKLRVAKTFSGDQNVSMKLLAVQAVASPLFLVELKQFFSLSKTSFSNKGVKQNPILAQSLSGSVDLFYDADQGAESRQHVDLVEPRTTAPSTASELSNVLIDAWKAKTETKVSWVVDLDIYAPILIIPESCTDPSASVLVFNFGHLRLEYGKLDVSPKVNDWYATHPQHSSAESTLDIGALRVDNLTFVIGRVGDKGWREMLLSDGRAASDAPAIVAPISIHLDVGVESRTKHDIPRLCAFAVIPVIALGLSPSQASGVLAVYRVLMRTLKELSIGSPEGVTIVDDLDMQSPRSEPSSPKPKRRASKQQQHELASLNPPATKSDEKHPLSHFEVALQRLSVNIVGDEGDGIEGHLISVSAAASTMSDGTTTTSLRMGWFWVLDRFENKFPRRQRLLVHSTLPKSPLQMAEERNFAILDDLQRLGVFEPNFAGSTELADVTLKTGKGDQSALSSLLSDQGSALASSACWDVEVAAKFSSLFVHLNPKGLRTLTDRLSQFQVVLEKHSTTPFATEMAARERLATSLSLKSSASQDGTQDAGDKQSKWAIKAELKHLEISLNSARDDLPLFILAMTGSEVRLLSAEQNLMAYLKLGDLRMTTADLGRTLPEYRTLVGLAPGRNESLLNIQYCVGTQVIQVVAPSAVDLSKCEAFAKVELSPMRIVHIQAQTMALVQYITDGILGALAAQAASSAVVAAKELSASIAGEKVFAISATAAEVLLPRAAHCPDYFAINAGVLSVTYKLLSDPGGSNVNLLLSKVTLRDSSDRLMQEDAVQMKVDVVLPPPLGSDEDQAMLVNIDISKASFLLSKKQYATILRMLDENIGEQDLFLRDTLTEGPAITHNDDFETTSGAEESWHPDAGKDFLQGINHAGVLTVEAPRRLYMNIKVEVLSLELRGLDNDPIVCIAAVETGIVLKLIPDELKMRTEVSLLNLLCEDKRHVALQRQYRTLIEQSTSSNITTAPHSPSQDFFHLLYERDDKKSLQIVDLSVGSPRVVFIPDAVAAILNFFQTSDTPARPKTKEAAVVVRKTEQHSLPGVLQVDVREDHETIETSLASADHFAISTMSVSLATSKCSVVLVDLGSQIPEVWLPTGPKKQLAETIVLQGFFDGAGTYSTSQRTGKIIDASVQAHGKGMEIYSAFGRELKSPLQIMEPAELSVFGTFKLRESASEIDIRAATLSPLDVTLSMQNAALLTAILASVAESLQVQNDSSQGEEQLPLSKEDKARIEKLARDLDESGTSIRSLDHDNSIMEESSIHHPSETWDVESSLAITIKVTMAETKMTFINDLQGIDEALFRFTVRNFVTGCNIHHTVTQGDNGKSEILLDCHFLTSILADYFDSSSNLWNVLLKEPWEISLKVAREPSRRFRSDRLMTTVDLESYPCYISFSEQFLVSLAAAKRMWAIYSAAVASAADVEPENSRDNSPANKAVKRSLAARAARNLTTTLPYAVDNHSGVDVAYVLQEGSDEQRSCPSGSIQYFRFDPPRGKGYGGKRRYGQDLTRGKALRLIIENTKIDFPHLDKGIGSSRSAHVVGGGHCFFTWLVKEGRTTVLHISSCVEVHNLTLLSFALQVKREKDIVDVGVCHPGDTDFRAPGFLPTITEIGATLVKPSRRFGVSVETLSAFYRSWTTNGTAALSLAISPRGIPNCESLEGNFFLQPTVATIKGRAGKKETHRFEVVCRSEPLQVGGRWPDPLSVLVRCEVSLVDGKFPSVEIFLEPRALIENNFPVSISIRTPMPHTFNSSRRPEKQPRAENDVTIDSGDTTHEILPGSNVQIFTPGPSIAVTAKCSEMPVGGTPMGWMEGGWIDLPLVSEFRLLEPLRCRFPFIQANTAGSPLRSGALGNDFYVAESTSSLEEIALGESANHEREERTESSDKVEVALSGINIRTFNVTVLNYAIDHTGGILFEQLHSDDKAFRQSASSPQRRSTYNLPTQPLTAFASPRHRSRITLLPAAAAALRVIYLTMDEDEGMTRSAPFRIEDISICHGGAESTSIKWADGADSGFYAYRRLVNSYQSEIHLIPEFIVFNGSKNYQIHVTVQSGGSAVVEPGQFSPLRSVSQNHGLIISVEYVTLGVRSQPLRVDSLGLRVAFLRSDDSTVVGSLAMQTVIGTCDSRLVIKLGDLKPGGQSRDVPSIDAGASPSLLQDDFIRFRVRWTELRVTLNEALFSPYASKEVLIVKTALNQILEPQPPKHSASWSGSPESVQKKQMTRGHYSEREEGGSHAVCTIVLSRFTVDWQRVFKDERPAEQSQPKRAIESAERSQLSVIVHNVEVRDETPGSPYPIVFDSTSNQISFFDLCVRFRGPLDADLIKVDLVDLNLAHVNGISESIVVNTSEDFIWKLLDLANRLVVANAETAGAEIQLKWDDRNEEYFVIMVDEFLQSAETQTVRYSAPKSDTLFDISMAKVSPFTMMVTFKRTPLSSRYKLLKDFRGATLLNYFTRRLKFKIDKAELKFSRYETRDVKGPPDRIFQEIMAVYLARMKLKLVTLMTAASFQDWKFLASRDKGDDEYMEGDLLRVTGNLAGNTAGYIFKTMGRGLGSGVSAVTSSVGNTIETATEAVGAKALGAGVNSVITGIGDGVGSTIMGVGAGAGKVARGAGKGIGHVFGGVTGGAMMIGKGIGKGVTTGDGKAVLSGIAEGATSVSTGFGEGVGTAVIGAADGVLAVGQGLFSGVKSVGKGIGGAFTGCRCGLCFCCSSCFSNDDETLDVADNLESPLLPLEEQNELPPDEQSDERQS